MAAAAAVAAAGGLREESSTVVVVGRAAICCAAVIVTLAGLAGRVGLASGVAEVGRVDTVTDRPCAGRTVATGVILAREGRHVRPPDGGVSAVWCYRRCRFPLLTTLDPFCLLFSFFFFFPLPRGSVPNGSRYASIDAPRNGQPWLP